MKRINFLLTVLSSLSVMACAGNDTITSDTNRLPASSRHFLSVHFKETPVSHIQIEKDLVRISSYDVILTDGTNVEFDRNGEWTEIKRHRLPIPRTIIPAVIQDHIRRNHSSEKIVAIEKDTRDYEIKLDNGLEMKFDLAGNLIDIDNE